MENQCRSRSRSRGSSRKGKIERFRIKLIDSQGNEVISRSEFFKIEPKTATMFYFTEPKADRKTYWCKGNSQPIRWKISHLAAGSYNIDLIEERSDQVIISVAQGVGVNGPLVFNANQTNQGSGFSECFSIMTDTAAFIQC